MAFIPDEKTAVLDKPTASFIPDTPTPSFVLDKPTKSFIPDAPFNISSGIEGAKSAIQNVPIIAGFTPKQIELGSQLLGNLIERPVAGLRGIAKEGLPGFKKGITQPEEYPVGTFAEVYQTTFPKMSPIISGTLGAIADAGYYFGMPEALTRVATAGKLKLLESTIANINDALKAAGETREGIVTIHKEALENVAKNTDIGTVVDTYLKSKGAKFTRDTGLLETKVTPGEVVVPKDIAVKTVEIKPTPSFVPDTTPTAPIAPVIVPEAAKTPIPIPASDAKAEGGGKKWWQEAYDREGLRTKGYPIVEADLQNESVREAIRLDPTLTQAQKGSLLSPEEGRGIEPSLLEEARKYKNAEEFVKNVKKDNVLFFDNNPKETDYQARKIVDMAIISLPERLRNLSLDDTERSIENFEEFAKHIISETKVRGWGGIKNEKIEGAVNEDRIRGFYESDAFPPINKIRRERAELNLLNKLIDRRQVTPEEDTSVIDLYTSAWNEKNLRIKVFLNSIIEDLKEQIIEKSQLTSIWNKAQSSKLSPQQGAGTKGKVKEIPAPKGKITILPHKEQLLFQIEEAIKKAPEETPIINHEEQKITFQIDGGAKIFNNKKALQGFYDKIKKSGKEMFLTSAKQGLPRAQGIETFEKAYSVALKSGNKKDIQVSKDNLEQAKKMLNQPSGREAFIKVDMLNPARWDNVRQFIEDDWLRVKRLIQQKGANVTETNNSYEAEIRYWGRIGARTEEADRLISDIDKDIVTISKKIGISDKLLNKEVDRFLIARHAPERNAKHGEGAAGITDKQAYEIRAEIAGKPYAKEVERIADRIQELNNKTLDTLLEGEVITKELYDSLRTLYKNHIPLNRVMSEEDDIVEVLTKRGFDVQGAGLKRAKGSELEVADILTNVVANYKAALARSEKNIVDNYTLRFARENEYFDGLFEEIKPKAIGKSFDGRIILEQIKDPHVLPVREKGKQIYLKINDPQLAMALRGVNRQKVDGLMRAVKAFTRFYSGLMTRFNPEFVVSNKIRDLQEVAVYLASKNEIGFKGTVEAIIKDPQSIKDVTDAIRGKDTEGTRLYKQMKMDGGTTGGMGLSTREQLEINLERVRAINRSNPRKAAEIILRSIDQWNTIFEDSTRLSVYRQALKQGVSRNKAAVLAKEASVNFNKMGTGGPVINAIYMFSNSSIQGTAKMLRAMRNPKVCATVLILLGGAVALVAEYNDRKDKDWRKKVSKWDRLNGLNIVISTDKGIKYATIPISWALKPIKVFFDEVGDLASGHETSISKAVGGLVTATVEAYNPAGGTDMVSAITPSILDLPVDLARNRSWTGGKIRPDWNNSAPASIQYFDGLRKTAIGQAFIKITREWGENGFEISPADMKYSYDQLIGGTGRFVSKALNTIVGAVQGKVEAKEIPFASRFYRDIPEEQIREFGPEYAELKKKLQSQDKARFYLNQEAELVWDGLKQIPIENRRENYSNIRKTSPWLADKINEIAKEEQANLTYTDRLIKKLGVENGERSKYLWDKISKMDSVDERKTYYKDMRKKDVITDEVARQIKIRARKK